MKKSDLSKKRREFDPHWTVLKKIHSAAEGHIKEMHEKIGLGDRLLAGMEDRTEERAQSLIERAEKLRDYLEENKSRIAEAVSKFAASNAKLKKMQALIEKELSE